MRNARKITEGAILLAAFAVLLLITTYVPLIGAFLNLALPIPFILFAVKNEWKLTFLFVIASVLISFIAGTLLALPLTLTYGITGAVMGYLIQKNRSRTSILLAGSVIFLLSIVIQYAVSVTFFHFNFIDQIFKAMNESLKMSGNILKEMGQGQKSKQVIEQYKKALDLMKIIIPSIFVIASFMTVFIIQLLSVPVLKRFGVNLGNWKPFREISLPKQIVWYYLIITLISMAVRPQTGTYWSSALINLTFIMQLLMVFQGLTFIYYFFYQRNVSKSLPAIVTVLTFIYAPLVFAVGILGIIDLSFDLRERLANKK